MNPSPRQSLEAELSRAKAAEAFVADYHLFRNRAVCDVRMRDENGDKVDGRFAVGNPAHQMLMYGTEDEARRGLLTLPDAEHIRPYSSGRTSPPVTTPGVSYDWQGDAVGLCPASRIAIVRGWQSEEAAVFFFPLKGCFLVVEIGGRYGETSMYLFDGDPTDLLQGRGRNPRHAEIDTFFAAKDDWRRRIWDVPPEVPMTCQWNTGTAVWVNPEPVHLCQLTQAVSALFALGHLGNA